MYLIFALFITVLVDVAFSAIPTPSQQSRNTTISQTPVYNIGIIFPNAKVVREDDPSLGDMIVTSELAIQLANDAIKKSNILPDVQLNFTRYYSDESNPGKTAWAAVNMVENGVDAVIGDMISSMTEASASISGIWQIPQCSCASASYSLTDKSIYPYFFRTVGSVVLYGESLVDWVDSMGWSMFALIYTNDAVGQQVLHSMLNQADKHGITAMAQIPLYSLTDEQIEESLSTLESSGSRVVVLADSNTNDQIAILNKAMKMGLLTEGWVWILTNDVSPVLQEIISSREELAMYDGLMFISGLWDLSGEPSYDSLSQIWQKQRVPEDFNHPNEWNKTGLSYNAPQAYACTELLARGLDHALNTYPGGRSVGLSDLSKGTFNSSRMTPEFYNLNYTGPAGTNYKGYMGFSDTGDLQSGYFQILYMLNGSSVPYATVKLNKFEFISDTEIMYLGHTTQKPMDMIPRYALNPTVHQVTGIVMVVICGLGLLCSQIMMVLIFWFRHLKPIMVSSPIFCYLQLMGISLTYISVLLYLEKPNVAKCIARQIILVIGFALVIGSIIAKNYRIYRIFQNVFTVRTSRLKSYYLCRLVALFLLIGLIPLIIWYAAFPMQVSDAMISSSTYCWLCTYPTATKGNWGHINIAELIVLIWCALLIIVAAFLAFKTRNVNRKWSETTQIAYVSYNAGLAACVASPSFFIPVESFVTSIFLKISSVLFAATFTLIVLFLPKFLLIVRHIIKSNKKFSLYRMNTESHAELTKQSHSESLDENLNLNLVAKNMLDFTVKAHEGILPVKKLARFEFFSIWELKHIVLVPMKRFFILSNKSGMDATMHHYIDWERLPTKNKNHHTFSVRTVTGLTFMFQVSDREALDRWLNWFEGVDTSPNRGRHAPASAALQNPQDSSESRSDSGEKLSINQDLSMPKMQSATFGVNDSSSMIPNSASFFNYTADFYTPMSYSDTHHQLQSVDNSNSAIYNNNQPSSAYSSNIPHTTSNRSDLPMASNSFGVVNHSSSWQRYP
ncbi:hypothetical protein MAM1_0004c00430 [Mucor ambiguus]|uniref:G-protein coupled receptors family 3 profile domain-containing protein n=1 Tax=Mucor ambiguus TaxID=91626 RepID=A0A0C9LZX9_9FUNG|nr:hypothetical protein MAM1_0004c00430 [Mucor ambiguus]